MSTAAKLLRDARRHAGLTQAELAERLGTTQSAVAKLERAEANPTVQTLDRAVAATGHRLQLITPAFGEGADVSLLRQALRRTPGQRIEALERPHDEVRAIRVTARPEADEPAFRPTRLLTALAEAGVDFVVVGGVAVNALGYERYTKDLDICYSSLDENLQALGNVLVAMEGRLRGLDEDVPFVPDGATFRGTQILTLNTSAGGIDLLVEPAGAPRYEVLREQAELAEIGTATVRVASLQDMLAMKRASGRPQDLADVEALEQIQRMRRYPDA